MDLVALKQLLNRVVSALELYLYCGNGPVARTDPRGLQYEPRLPDKDEEDDPDAWHPIPIPPGVLDELSHEIAETIITQALLSIPCAVICAALGLVTCEIGFAPCFVACELIMLIINLLGIVELDEIMEEVDKYRERA